MIKWVLLGCMSALPLYFPFLSWFAWIAAFPLFWMLDRQVSTSSTYCYFFGLMLASSFWSGGWHSDSTMLQWCTSGAMIALQPLILMLPLQVVRLMTRMQSARATPKTVVLVCVCTVTIDLLFSFTPIAYPITYWGHLFVYADEVKTWASVLGVNGLTFWLVFLSGLCYCGVAQRNKVLGCVAVLCIVATYVMPAVGFDRDTQNVIQEPTLLFELQQDGLSGYERWQKIDSVVMQQTANTQAPVQVFSESSIVHTSTLESLKERAFSNNCVYIAGYIHSMPNSDGVGQNKLVLIDQQGQMQSYSKRWLVPFIEYAPWQVFVSTPTLGEGPTTYMPGTSSNVLTTRIQGQDLSVIPLVCLDGLFPLPNMSSPDKHPNCIVLLSNDSWFPTWPGGNLVAELNTFRAHEAGCNLVRVAPTGVSGVYDVETQTWRTLPPETQQAQTVPVIGRQLRTIYESGGNAFPYVCSLLCVVWLIRERSRATRVPSSEE